MKKIGFIDYYLDEWHANNYPQLIREESQGELEVTCAYGHIDSPIGGMTTEQWCQTYGIRRCMSIEEVIEQSDLLLVLSPDNCEMHEQLCQLPLRSGKPTYVDKTFAPDGPTAQRIFDIAHQYGTPCYSTSALRFASEYASIDRAGITAISSWGPNDFETYAIHQLEPMMMLMGSAAEQVMYLPGDGWYTVLLRFCDGRVGTLSGYAGGSPFMMNIASTSGNQLVQVQSNFFRAFIRELCHFFQTAQVRVPHEETLAIMSVRGAVLRAQQMPGQWVQVQ